MIQNEKLLTIGQFAAMHGINKKTLMWYDEIGLFRPAAVIPENGYRCYSYRRSAILETILLLRELDVSVSEIQDFMKNRSAASLKILLEEKITALDQSIEHLRSLRKTLCSYHEHMETLLTMDLSQIRIVEKEERALVTVEITGETSFEKEVEMITAATKKCQLRRLHDASYGTMLPVESIYGGHFEDYTRLFIEIPDPTASVFTEESAEPRPRESAFHIQPAGRYIQAFHKGPWKEIPRKYREILDFAEAQNLTLWGFSYEMGINENVIERMEDYITQIEIGIKTPDPFYSETNMAYVKKSVQELKAGKGKSHELIEVDDE